MKPLPRSVTTLSILMSASLLAGGAAMAGCGSSGNSSSTDNGSTATSSNASNASASSSGAGGNSSSSGTGAGGSGGEGEGGGGSEDVVRFIAMGDGGEGNGTQLQVAQVIKSECDARGGCMFALYLGDNIYDTGVDSVMDQQFQDKFEIPYAELDFRFYITLGNHDYGGGGAGFEFWKGDYQVDYTMYSMKWFLPDNYYMDNVVVGDTTVDLFSLDTNAIMYTGASTQKNWLQGETALSTATWKLAFGHHTYISNGTHGNAGNYEPFPTPPIVNGSNVKSFMDDAICGQVDVYFCGHDHNRQWLQPTCGTEFIVSGTAAKHTDLHGHGTPTFFETDVGGGFLLVEISGNTFTGWFYDENGTMEFTRTITKP